jgi:hypothetical protein
MYSGPRVRLYLSDTFDANSFIALLGLSTNSTILFAMVLGLIVNSRSTSAKVDGLGILQVLLQFMQDPEAQEIVTHVDHPTVDNLRHEGMVER